MKEVVSEEAGALDGLRVLVVDDGYADRTMTCETLLLAGATVSHGCDGHEGLELAVTHRYDAIVLDIEMPRVNGFEVVRRLRIMGIETPIYALTSLRIPPEDPRREKCNVSGWFQKPLNGALLVRALSLPGRYAIRPQVHPDFEHERAKVTAFDAGQMAHASPRILAVVERFSDEIGALVEGIATASTAKDETSLKSQLHRLRGSAGSCGFIALMGAVERWEDALDAGSVEDDAFYLIGLRRAAEEGREAFRQFLRSRGTTSLNA